MPLARQQRHFGVEGLQQGAFAASDPADEVDEFACGDLQIDPREHHFAFAQQASGGLVSAGVGVADGCVAKFYDRFLIHSGCSGFGRVKVIKKSDSLPAPAEKRLSEGKKVGKSEIMYYFCPVFSCSFAVARFGGARF